MQKAKILQITECIAENNWDRLSRGQITTDVVSLATTHPNTEFDPIGHNGQTR